MLNTPLFLFYLFHMNHLTRVFRKYVLMILWYNILSSNSIASFRKLCYDKKEIHAEDFISCSLNKVKREKYASGMREKLYLFCLHSCYVNWICYVCA